MSREEWLDLGRLREGDRGDTEMGNELLQQEEGQQQQDEDGGSREGEAGEQGRGVRAIIDEAGREH